MNLNRCRNLNLAVQEFRFYTDFLLHYQWFLNNNHIHPIKIKNEYNLNIPRYIDSSVPEDLQNIDAHLHGGIPAVDVNSMSKYWNLFPSLKDRLFSVMREGFYRLNVPKEEVRNIIFNDEEFSAYSDRMDEAFEAWKNKVDSDLRGIDKSVEVKEFVVVLAELLLAEFADFELVDKYDVYQVLLQYWLDTMADDVFVLKYDGYEAGRITEDIIEVTTNKKGETKEKYKGWEGKLIPKSIVECAYFAEERRKIDEAQSVVDMTQDMLDELVEQETGDEGYLRDYLNDKDKIVDKPLKARLKEVKKYAPDGEECEILSRYVELADKVKKYSKLVKDLNIALDKMLREKYGKLSVEEIKELLVNRKWYYSVFDGISALYDSASRDMANRISELADRYENTLPELEQSVEDYEAKVKAHLERMGFAW